MQHHWRCDAVKRQHQPAVSAGVASVCGAQRTRCWRGQRPGPRPVARLAGEPQEPHEPHQKDWEGPQGGGSESGEGIGWTSPPAKNANQEQDNTLNAPSVRVTAESALAGMAAEARDMSPSPSGRSQYIAPSTDPTGWYSSNLFEVLQSAEVDAQAASHFFFQLAIHDSWANPLSLEELLHAARLADITGFTLPPIVASQLHQLVQSAGPVAAAATAEPLLASYMYDLPALLDMLQAMEVTPSVAWTDYALRSWLAGGGDGAAAAAPLTAASVRAAMTLLEAIYLPSVGPAVEPRTVVAAPTPAPSAPNDGAWRSTAPPAPDASVAAAAPDGDSYAAGSVRAWLDACLLALLDGGVLGRDHQREDLYDMLPHLATAPSPAVVERLWAEAWPPAATSSTPSSSSSAAAASSPPEHIASMLWLVAASGAKLPPAVIQGLLRALESSVLRLAANDGNGGDGSRGGGRGDSGDGGSWFAASAAADAVDAAAAAAALNSAFSLPSAAGAGGREPNTPPPSPASSAVPFSPPSADRMLFPPAFGTSPPSPAPRSPSRAFGRRLTPYGAYLALWALHHYRHTPHAATARLIAPTLLGAAIGSGGGGGLGPRQRCRVVRAVLMCFAAVPPYLMARFDWSSLFRGWETLGASELLPLLEDLATLARQRRRQRRHAGRGGTDGGGGGAQLLRLSQLAAFVVQLPGWQRRLAAANVGLSAAVASVEGLLVVLGEDAGDAIGDVNAAAAASGSAESGDRSHEASAATDGGDGSYASDGDGDASGAVLLGVPFAQEVLSNWLGNALPVIQDEIKKLTGDWGLAGRATGAGGAAAAAAASTSAAAQPRWGGSYPPEQPHGVRRDVYGMSGGGSAAADTEPARPSVPVAVVDTDASDADAAPRSASWLPPPVTAAAAAPPPTPPQLAAVDLMAALMALRDTAAALDARVHPAIHRTLMWAMQRLGSRAGRAVVEPGVFAMVPDMLVRVDALGWVEVPLEWAHSVVTHPDAEAAWFRRLPWPRALRAVLVSGQLVQRARAEVLRRHGADGAAAVAAAVADAGDQSLPQPPPSRAAALLGATQRLRGHLLRLLAARAAAAGGPELRQLALTWQVYGMPYDKEALAATLGALEGVAAAAAAVAADMSGDAAAAARAPAVAAVTRGSIRDAAARLEMMCEAHQVPREEMDSLFAALRVYGV